MNVRIASATTIRSGVMTSRIDHARGVAQQLVHRDQVAHQPLDLVHHPLVGQRDVEEHARQRPRGGQHRLLRARAPCPATSAPRPGTTAAAASPRSARSRRRSRPTRPTRRGALSSQQARTARRRPAGRSAPRPRSGPRRAPSARRRATPRPRSSGARARPGPAPAAPAVRRPTAVGVPPTSRLQHVGQRVRRVGRDARACARRAAAQRRAVAAATDVFPTPPLPV